MSSSLTRDGSVNRLADPARIEDQLIREFHCLAHAAKVA